MHSQRASGAGAPADMAVVNDLAALGRARPVRFAMIGSFGFVVDLLVLRAMLAVGLDPYLGRAASFLAAVSATWWGNRHLTFADRRAMAWGSEWRRFVLANGPGAALNYGTYALLIGLSPWFALRPSLALVAGSLAGLACNYVASCRFVFPPHPAPDPGTGDSRTESA